MKAAGTLLLLLGALMCLTPDKAEAASGPEEGREPTCQSQVIGCPKNYDPVCGTDGQTYSNMCELCLENQKKNIHIRIRREGPCERC